MERLGLAAAGEEDKPRSPPPPSPLKPQLGLPSHGAGARIHCSGAAPAHLNLPLLLSASQQEAPAAKSAEARNRAASGGGGGGDPRRSDFYLNLGAAVRALRDDLPAVFLREPNYDIYREDITFVDPLNTFHGIDNYKTIFWALRFHGRLLFSEIGLDREAEALLSWKASLAGADESLSSWSWANSTSVCHWMHISCNSARSTIIKLNISGASLNGTLDKFDFSAFPNLKKLILFQNGLHGNIPEGIGGLTSLARLRISSNRYITGTIPRGIGRLKQLTELQLGGLGLDGVALPEEIGNLTSLTKLALYSISLTGSIPLTFGRLKKLRLLNLRNNSLTGRIPPEIGNMTELHRMDLTQNYLHGQIPGNGSETGHARARCKEAAATGSRRATTRPLAPDVGRSRRSPSTTMPAFFYPHGMTLRLRLAAQRHRCQPRSAGRRLELAGPPAAKSFAALELAASPPRVPSSLGSGSAT
ncbi:hypothetical protein ZWY2020_013492 [Hordeum vulgare]|nr:hypothetical protein ZWY2020_013492 [Hordeum vulgare]